ncbi:hypothetical protein HNR42_002120 [Deinobacterium chartae]|uniref:DUF2809 domain-containing protein n=1 Tax=Deinobacterium chartae TaxID=521158 RepID=A0A841I452_9DEIO|nr:DUF2809 domain-containing protein [Deinobacterium chartae]MBB6098685.1 hypothetical protein [Deinobacterium chartae]
MSPAVRRAALAAVCLAGEVAVVLYGGPGRTWVRGTLGDLLATALLFFVLGALTRWSRSVRAGLSLGAGLLVELAQALRVTPSGGAGELLLGRHFDPLDLLAYALGVTLAASLEASLERPSPLRAGSR